MTTDGTKPPSITPRKSASRGPRATGPRSPSGSATATADTTKAAPPSTNGAPEPEGERSDPTTTASTTSAASSPSSPSSPSLGDRLKRAGQSVSGAARGGSAKPASTDETAAAPGRVPAPAGGPRRVRLAVSKIDPWSVMKLSFLMSVAIGIMIVVAAAVIWYTLDGLAVFTQVNDTIAEITGDPAFFDVLEYMAFERVISLATIIGVVDIVLLTALATIGAFLYNIVAALVGGIHVTLTDD
jgi:hypothetical protein